MCNAYISTMKKTVHLLLCLPIIGVLFAKPATSSANAAFNTFKFRFIEALWKANPGWATENGYHKWDSVLIVPDEAGRRQQKTWAAAYLDSLKQYKLSDLDVANQTDLKLIQNQLESTIWSIDTKREWQWNPANYNVTGGIAYMLSEPYDKLENRLLNICKRLEKVPAYYEAAKAAVQQPVKELKELAIQQNEGGLSALEKDFADSLKAANLSPSQKQTIATAAREAQAAVKSYVAWLKGVPDEGGRSFRLGKELYDVEFKYDIQSSLTADELHTAAQNRKEYLTGEMEKKANLLWPKYFGNASKPEDRYALIRKVIDTVSAAHVKPEDFRRSIEQQIPKLAAFVRSKNLLYLDPSKPLKVRDEPGYMAGVAGASVSAPGPYDKDGKTYYNVGSLDGWTPERAESYLREYNNYTLQILNMHEGIPGHYAQLVYANKSPDIVKAILGNGSMIEGWAVYSELVMMEAGYDNSPEMWLMYYKWNLRSVCNTILDISVHTKNMSKEDALDLLVRQAFQQQAEAEGKWRRVSVSHVQLTSYFNGFYEILQLRDAWKKKVGAAYNVKAFNEKFLSYGSVPVKYISEMMLGGK
jgi:uncharacterized protein (DUF885 family)